jgi:drug/metabolite transporter (DMT)-like permease
VTGRRVVLLTLFAMIAFAANSLLCRAALKHTGIDAASFTFLRICSGALALYAVAFVQNRNGRIGGTWPSALSLFGYAAGLSFAYISLPTGTGALLLFGAVQATMILWGWHRGERLRALQLVGLAVAVIGLITLVLPGLAAPPLVPSLLMLIAGVAWGIYSLRGKTAVDAVGATAGNFIRAIPFAAILMVRMFPHARVDSYGIIYAIASGAIASGLGYAIWYTALPALKAASAATVQLSVPVLAATGGILLLGESLTLRFVIASVAVLGGIALVISNPAPRR